MKNSMFPFILFLLGACSLVAQKSLTLKGLVISGYDQSKLIGASVSLDHSSSKAFANIDGNFLLKSESPLPWNITVKYLGFLDQHLTIKRVDDFHTIKMQEDPFANNKVIVCPIHPTTEFSSNIIKGRVIDHLNKTPLIAAIVQVSGAKTVTDFDGYFELKIPFTRDVKTLMVSYEGYPSVRMTLKNFPSGTTIEMDSRKK